MVRITSILGATTFLAAYVAAMPTFNDSGMNRRTSDTSYGGSSGGYGSNGSEGQSSPGSEKQGSASSDSQWNDSSASQWTDSSAPQWTDSSASQWTDSSTSQWTDSSNSKWTSSSASQWTASSDSQWTSSADSQWTATATYTASSSVETWSNSQATATSSAYSTYSTPVYGSGSAPWSGSSYDDCVSQCMAQYGSPPSPWTPSPTNTPDSPSGTGATHTVIVAPSQGVFRYVPFAVNASVGDTIKFMWGANAHTVTKSSVLTPCNSTKDSPFASGQQDKGFVFMQTVNDTNPMYFHCAVPTHCTKGMFGIINPPNAFAASTSVSQMMSSMKADNPHISAYAAMIDSATNKNDTRSVTASRWGGSIDMAALPDWSHSLVAENVLYTRNFLAVNPDMIKDNGKVDLSASGTNPMMVPMDVNAALTEADNSSASPSGPATPTTEKSTSPTSTGAPSDAENASAPSNGAVSISSPRVLIGLSTIIATIMIAL